MWWHSGHPYALRGSPAWHEAPQCNMGLTGDQAGHPIACPWQWQSRGGTALPRSLCTLTPTRASSGWGHQPVPEPGSPGSAPHRPLGQRHPHAGPCQPLARLSPTANATEEKPSRDPQPATGCAGRGGGPVLPPNFYLGHQGEAGLCGGGRFPFAFRKALAAVCVPQEEGVGFQGRGDGCAVGHGCAVGDGCATAPGGFRAASRGVVRVTHL